MNDRPRFRRPLKNERNVDAAEDAYDDLMYIFSTSDPQRKIAATKKLDEYCQKWLSPYGWKRLQTGLTHQSDL